ncbi:MAG: hypothetical protein IPP25_16235 [Saprospiraceae bacterium]|nr:hypothetical protein [Candidatus Opimibacter skivensis]
MQVIKHKEETLFDEFFEVRRGILQFERFDGTLSPEVTRYSFSKWDAVAVLVYHKERDAYILVKQIAHTSWYQSLADGNSSRRYLPRRRRRRCRLSRSD